jgi:hypothetical protein
LLHKKDVYLAIFQTKNWPSNTVENRELYTAFADGCLLTPAGVKAHSFLIWGADYAKFAIVIEGKNP